MEKEKICWLLCRGLEETRFRRLATGDYIYYDIKFLGKPFMEADPGANQVTVGQLWFRGRRANPVYTRQTPDWVDGKLQASPFTRGLFVDLMTPRHPNPAHQTDVERRDKLFRTERPQR